MQIFYEERTLQFLENWFLPGDDSRHNLYSIPWREFPAPSLQWHRAMGEVSCNGLRLQISNPDFSGSRYVRGQEQLVTRAAPKRPHAPDQAHHPYVKSAPSLPMHFLAATFRTNALAGNWRH